MEEGGRAGKQVMAGRRGVAARLQSGGVQGDLVGWRGRHEEGVQRDGTEGGKEGES